MQAKPRWLTILDYLSALMLLAATVLVLVFTPVEAVMGPVQKVFYFHVSTAWVGMLGFGVAAVVGIFYLRTSDRKWDLAAVAAVEIGLVFTLICIVLGSIWARPIWNAWWTWDPRLTTATIMELIYAAYLMLRQGLDEPEKRARFGAVYAIIGVVSVPLTFVSIRIFRRKPWMTPSRWIWSGEDRAPRRPNPDVRGAPGSIRRRRRRKSAPTSPPRFCECRGSSKRAGQTCPTP